MSNDNKNVSIVFDGKTFDIPKIEVIKARTPWYSYHDDGDGTTRFRVNDKRTGLIACFDLKNYSEACLKLLSCDPLGENVFDSGIDVSKLPEYIRAN